MPRKFSNTNHFLLRLIVIPFTIMMIVPSSLNFKVNTSVQHLTLTMRPKMSQKCQHFLISWPYLESIWEMHSNKHKLFCIIIKPIAEIITEIMFKIRLDEGFDFSHILLNASKVVELSTWYFYILHEWWLGLKKMVWLAWYKLFLRVGRSDIYFNFKSYLWRNDF